MAMKIIEPQSSERDINKLESKSQGLTKMDIKALRQADTIVFHINKITAMREKEGYPFSEMRYTVPVEYEKEAYGKGTISTAYYVLPWAKNEEVWQTISSLLKNGDKIILSWKKGWGDNELLENKGLTEDALFLKIKRREKIKYVFLVNTQIGRKKDGGMIR